MAKRRAMAVLTGGAVALLAGCGGGGSSSSGSSASSQQNIGGSLSVWAVWSGDEQKAFTQVLQAFQQQSGVTPNFQSKGDQLPTVLGTAISGGAPPEVAVLPQPGLLKDLVAKNALKPVDNIVGDIVGSDYASAWKKLGTVNDKLYGVYFKGANKSTIWYDVKAFKNAGITPPKTFDDLLSDLTTLKASGVPPFAMCGGSGWTLTDWFENVYLRVAGPSKYNDLAQHKIPWTDPSVTQTLDMLSKIWKDPSNFLGGTDHAVSTPFPDCAQEVFSGHKAAMIFEADFVQTTIAGLGNLQPGTDYDYFPWPSINNSKTAVSGGGDVAVMLKDTPQAEALMKFLASPDAGQIWAKLGGFVSPNTKIDSSVYPNDVAKRVAKDLVGAGDNFAYDMSDQAPAAFGGTAGAGEWADLQAFLRNPGDVQGIQQKLEADAKSAYGH